MYCHNCGSQIPDDSVFCPECGSRQENLNPTEPIPVSDWEDNYQAPTDPYQASKDPYISSGENYQTNAGQAYQGPVIKRKSKLPLIIIAGLVWLMLVGGGGFFVWNKFFSNRIDLNKYATISVEGDNGAGYAYLNFDFDAFVKDYEEVLKKKTRGTPTSDYYGPYSQSFLSDCVDYDIEPAADLSNGDKVTLSWHCDKDLAKERYGVNIKDKDLVIKVEGLNDSGESNSLGLGQGDPGLGESAGAFNYAKANKYIADINSITDNDFSNMRNKAETLYRKEGAGRDKADQLLEALEYEGIILLANNNMPSYSEDNNLCALVYKVRVHQNYSNAGRSYSEPFVFYWYIAFKNLTAEGAGYRPVNLDESITPENSIYVDSGIDMGNGKSKKWRLRGYESLEDLRDELIIRGPEDYTIDDNTF